MPLLPFERRFVQWVRAFRQEQAAASAEAGGHHADDGTMHVHSAPVKNLSLDEPWTRSS
jgi:hypothetical protein